MCGILAVHRRDGQNVSTLKLQAALRAQQHRGPDDHGWVGLSPQGPPVWTRDTAELAAPTILGHQRLAILDLSPQAAQPMASPEQRYWMVYNGEVYNYLELRRELESLGYSFRSSGDSEVVLTAYRAWGKECLQRLVGMFALAILDRTQRCLFLARDFFGIKPLYYSRHDDQWVIASEIKTILATRTSVPAVDPQRALEYLSRALCDGGGRTFFEGIAELPAAHFLELDLDSPDTPVPVRYWDTRRRPLQLDCEQACAKLRSLFLESIGYHLRSDVPVGACLSGGIDSSSIVSCIRRFQPGGELHTFSFIADQEDINEEKWVDLLSNAQKTHNHKARIDPEAASADLDNLVLLMDEPFGSTSIYAQHKVFQLVGQNSIKVVLDGQGADEQWAGYFNSLGLRLAAMLKRGLWGAAWSFFRLALPKLGLVPLVYYTLEQLWPSWLMYALRELLGQSIYPKWLTCDWFKRRGLDLPDGRTRFGGSEFLHQNQKLHFDSTLISLLRYEDRNSMHFSVESRVPFLTPELVEFVYSLPEEWILDDQTVTKALFRRAMSGITPESILARQDKIGFAIPEETLLQRLRPWVEDILSGPAAVTCPFIRIDVVRQRCSKWLEGRASYPPELWRVLNLLRWQELLRAPWP